MVLNVLSVLVQQYLISSWLLSADCLYIAWCVFANSIYLFVL